MEVICLQDEAFYALIEEVTARLKKDLETEKLWVGEAEAMSLLNIKAKSTLQKLRDQGEIRYSQPHRKNISYDRHSIDLYHERHARNAFKK